jgi:hypothetical protein
MATTIIRKLQGVKPKSETGMRRIQATAHRVRGFPGDEAWAKTHEHAIKDIRDGRIEGDSTLLTICPECKKKGRITIMIEIGGQLVCDACKRDE